MAGYTKSYRDKWVHPIFRDLLEASIWAWMCDSAVWEDTRINYCGQMVSLSRGQLITSRSFISNGFRVGEQSIRTLLARLESDGMINQQPTSHGTIITICNYSKYQDCQPADNQQSNQPLTSGQPAPNHNKKELKEDKEGNELKKESLLSDFDELWNTWKPISTGKGSKKQAHSSYAKARKETDHGTIVRGSEKYMRYCHADGRYTKHISTWLNQRGWEDDYTDHSAFADKPSQPRQPTGNGSTSYERGVMASLARAQDPDYGNEV